MRFVGRAIDLRLAVYAVVALLTLAGIDAYRSLPQAVYPELSISRVDVRAELAGLSPSLVQASIARPLERELQGIPGVVQLDARSVPGAADIDVSFDPHVIAKAVALERVNSVVAQLSSELPAGTQVRVEPVGTNLFPLLSYAVSSRRMNLMALREYVEYDLKPQLIGTPGVALVDVLGGQVREIHVNVDPQLLAARGLGLAAVREAIAQTNTISAVGFAVDGFRRWTLLASGIAHDAAQVAAIPLEGAAGEPLTVGAIANVGTGAAPSIIRAGTASGPAVILNVYAQPGTSFTGVASAVAARLKSALAGRPDVVLATYYDPASLVASAVASLRDAILVGFVLSALVLLFFLRSWRSAAVAGAIIPIVIVIAFGAMSLLGQGLNLMTLGGLAMGVGLIIDDAIVVVENVDRHLGDGGTRRAAVETAVAEIAGPMITSTLTTIVVFAPLSLLTGVAGAFFRALAITLTVALVLSLVLAFVLTPNLALRFLRPSPEGERRAIAPLLRRYQSLLRAALARRTFVWIAAALVLAATALMALNLGTDFLPALDEGAFEMTYYFPPGSTLARTRAATHHIEQILQADPAIATSADLTGHSMTLENTDTPQGQNGATIRATLVPRNRRAPILAVISRLEDRIRDAYPQITLSTRQLLADMLSDLSNELAPIEIRVFGPQQAVLVPLASEVARRIGTVPGISDVGSGVLLHDPGIVVRARPDDAGLGLTPAQLAADEESIFGGSVVSEVIRNPLTIPIRVRYDLPAELPVSRLVGIPLVTPSGTVEPLGTLATFERTAPQSEINELNGRQYLPVTAQISGTNLGAVVAGMRRALRQLDVPAGYSLQIAGSYALQQRSFAEFARTIALSTILVFLVMLVQFRSLAQPLAIVAAIPLSLFGAALLLFATGLTLNVSSLMGVILLIGLVVKNGILLLEYAARRERAGLGTIEALAGAAAVRFRPIVMTTATALLGMV
ncbi:MAG: efflux RND transporter permease subunit, partial [Vulcanimicrobiaceae bacterium]